MLFRSLNNLCDCNNVVAAVVVIVVAVVVVVDAIVVVVVDVVFFVDTTAEVFPVELLRMTKLIIIGASSR